MIERKKLLIIELLVLLKISFMACMNEHDFINIVIRPKLRYAKTSENHESKHDFMNKVLRPKLRYAKTSENRYDCWDKRKECAILYIKLSNVD